jgi:hypothetical protein
MANTKNTIPDMSVDEASAFWDEHDFDEFDDVQEVYDLQFSLKKKKYIGIESHLYDLIASKAKQFHTTEEALIQEWLQEKVGA